MAKSDNIWQTAAIYGCDDLWLTILIYRKLVNYG